MIEKSHPSLYPVAVLDVGRRIRDIERRMVEAMAAGRQPTAELLAEALHEAAGALLLIVEAEERIRAAEDAAAARELRYMAAEARLSELLARVSALLDRAGE